MDNEALIKRIEKIVNAGVPAGVKLPPSVGRYLTLVELNHIYTPAAYFAERNLVGSLVEDVAQWETSIQEAQQNGTLNQIKAGQVAERQRLLAETTQASDAPDWNAILRSPETFAAWRQGALHKN